MCRGGGNVAKANENLAEAETKLEAAENKKRLNNTEDNREGVDKAKNAVSYAKAQKHLAENKWGSNFMASLVPEIAAFVMLLVRNSHTGTPRNKRGGVLLNTPDANINMLARNAIALQSDHGILLRAGPSRLLDKMQTIYKGNARLSWGSRDTDKEGNFPFELFNFYHKKAMQYVVKPDGEGEESSGNMGKLHFIAESADMRYTDADYLVQIGAVHKATANKHIIHSDVAADLERAEAQLIAAQNQVVKYEEEYTKAKATNTNVDNARELSNEANKNLVKARERQSIANGRSSLKIMSTLVVQNKGTKIEGISQCPSDEPGIYLITTKGDGATANNTILLDTPETSITMTTTDGKVVVAHKKDKKPTITLSDKAINLTLDEKKVSIVMQSDAINIKCNKGVIAIKDQSIAITTGGKDITLDGIQIKDNEIKAQSGKPLSLQDGAIKVMP